MKTSTNLFGKVSSAYHTYKLVILILSIVAAFMFGLCVIAPFIDSGIFPWIKNQMLKNNLIALLLDPEDMFINAFISSMVPVFMTWGVILLVYYANKDKLEEINNITKYFSFLTKGPGTLVLMIGFAIIGMSSYGFIKYGNHTSFIMVLVSGVAFVLVGFAYRAAGRLHLKQSKLLDKSAFCGGIIFIVFAFFTYTYGLLSGPVQLLLAIKKHTLSPTILTIPI